MNAIAEVVCRVGYRGRASFCSICNVCMCVYDVYCYSTVGVLGGLMRVTLGDARLYSSWN